MRILLNKNRSKTSTNVSNSIPINLVGKDGILPNDHLETSINEVDVYNEERNNSNLIRLTCAINPICSNVLFNNITEIVINEGSETCESLNYKSLTNIKEGGNKLLHKNKSMFDKAIKGIRDTQLSNEANGFDYHCGVDIFNNHILRSNTFKTVCKLSGNATSDVFNTISDTMRGYDGKQIMGYKDNYVGSETADITLHLYLADDILSYKECVSEKLTENNGWFGFINSGKFVTYDDSKNDGLIEPFDIYKPINNRKSCDFIDMYPSRDLFYFTPKYNKHRHRIEKNWNYCITYPSSSTTDMQFIRQSTNSLKACMFDDTLQNSVGTSGLKIYSVSMHGLSKGDIVNIYVNDDIVIRNANVVDVENEYIFSVYDNGITLSKKWKELTTEELRKQKFSFEGNEYTISGVKYKYVVINGNKCPILPTNKINLDTNVLDVSYKRVVDGNEVDYYVRIFSKLPNWKYANVKPNEYEIYKENSTILAENQTHDREFENHISKLAFSKNIYNDDVSEVVFTDNIDISYLKDNLGRPLTSIYFTIFKNNKGYKKWYGINGETISTKHEEIEYSHCFGKLNCAFRLSKESLFDETYTNSIMLNKLTNKKGFLKLDEKQDDKDEDDEINYYTDINFYGDLCCYSYNTLDEFVIQPIEFRFNTAQRELGDGDSSYNGIFNKLIYDEIKSDDYDNLAGTYTGFETIEKEIENANQRKEGYVYNPHNLIQIKTFSDNITQSRPLYYTIKDCNLTSKTIYTTEKHWFDLNDKFVLRVKKIDGSKQEFIYCEIDSVINQRKFVFRCVRGDLSDFSKEDVLTNGKVIKCAENVPNYATFTTEGSCQYIWREVIQNGFDTEGKVETYPFANGALYVNRNINLFVRRQDPNEEGMLVTNEFPFDNTSKLLDTTKENNYYQEEDIEC